VETLSHECTQPVGITTANSQTFNKIEINHVNSPHTNNAQVSKEEKRKKTTNTNKTVIKSFFYQYINLDTRVA